MNQHLIFPNTGLQVLSSLIHFVGVSFLAHCISRAANFNSISTFLALSWARICVFLVFIDSWLFLLISGVLIFGVGLEYNSAICSTAIYLCIGCYGTSKLFIYCFLIEKVHIVWSPTAGRGRFKSPVYIVCVVTVGFYGVIAALLLIGRIHYFRHDGACVVGLKKFSSIPLLAYDLYVNIFLTALFLWPLLRSSFLNPRVKRVATRTLLAAGVALTTSTINVTVITILDGVELGWLCLGSCGTDVFFNSFAIYWVTAGASSTTRLPNTTSMSPGMSKPPLSERHLSGDGHISGHPKPSTAVMCTACGSASDPSDHLSSEPLAKTDGADLFTPYIKKRESGKIAFAPLDAVMETGEEGQHGEHKNRNLSLSLPLNKTVPPPQQQQQQQQEPTPSRIRTFLSMMSSPFRVSKQPPGDSICSSIQITVTTEYEMDDRSTNIESSSAPASQIHGTVPTVRARPSSSNSGGRDVGTAI